MGEKVPPGLQAIRWAVIYTDRKGVEQIAYHTTDDNARSHAFALMKHGMTSIHTVMARGCATIDPWVKIPKRVSECLRTLYEYVPPITRKSPRLAKRVSFPPVPLSAMFPKGTPVMHPMFGCGIVMAVQAEPDGSVCYTLDFGCKGRKELIEPFARLRPLTPLESLELQADIRAAELDELLKRGDNDYYWGIQQARWRGIPLLGE